MLTPEQVTEIKAQIMQQIQNFPEDKKAQAQQQIESMDAEQLEQFLEQNNLVNQSEQQCIFCMIAQGKTESKKIEENSEAVAILEINPISQGHTIIIPKEHKDIQENKQIQSIKEKTTEKLKKLSPNEIISSKTELMGHSILNLIPIYKDETPESPRHKASPEELEQTLTQIQKEPEKPKEETKPKLITEEKMRLPERIP